MNASSPKRRPSSTGTAQNPALGLPILVLVVCLGLTGLVWRGADSEARRVFQGYFDYRVRDAQNRIEQRLQIYAQVVRDVHGVFAAAPVDRDGFRRYVAAMHLEAAYPGIQGVEFALAVPRADRGARVAAIRRSGQPGFALWPAGDRPAYAPVVYIEPAAGRNLRALGYDLYSEPVRRAALDLARDLDEVTLSGKVRLVQETDQDVQNGFLMCMPVFNLGPDATHPDLGQRRAGIRGWAIAAFRMDDLMAGVLGEQGGDLDLELYDGDGVAASALLYDSDRTCSAGLPASGAEAQLPIEFGHHRWTLKARALPGFHARLGPGRARTVLGAGLAGSLLLALLTWSLVRSRDRAEDLAEEREIRFRGLMMQVNDAILVVDAHGRILDCNGRATEHFGYSREELGHMDVADLNPDRQQVEETLVRWWQAGMDRVEAVHMRKDGSRVDVEVSIQRVAFGREQAGLAIIHDISERKRFQDELRGSEARFRAIFEHSSLGICWTDTAGVIQQANPAFHRMLGHEPGSLVGVVARSFAHPGELARNQAMHQELAEGRAAQVRAETRWLRKDGGVLWVALVVSLVPDGAGLVKFHFGMVEDITLRRQAEQELSLYQGRLEELNRSLADRVRQTVAQIRAKDQMLITQSRQAAMGEMIGNIAHQWRQPLNTLSMLLANLRDGQRYGDLEPEGLARALDRGDLLIQKMSATISVFTNFFRPGKEATVFSALDQIHAAVALVDATFAAGGIAIRVEAAEDLRLSGFPNEYSQVLLNLLGNAREAIGPGGSGSGVVTVGLVREEGFARLTVRDTGGGIPEALLERIFEPYFSTRETGTGIGLYLSRQIIEGNMRGRINARNVEGGAEFSVRVPLA